MDVRRDAPRHGKNPFQNPRDVFLATGLMAHKGAAATVPFPAFIALTGVVQIAVARKAAKRGWIA